MNGYNDIDYILSMKDTIIQFEKRYEKKYSCFTW